MDSLSRPFHRRKPSNAYDGVFSGHRPGAPAVNVDEYREIFSTTGSSIPVVDLNKMEDSASGELKPDYSGIFGGFRDLNIAVSYQELLARDKARAPSSITRTSQDPGDMSHESSDAMKQFNLSYNKISQRSKDGLDGTTHVTQLHAVPGFTCFVDESTSQPNKETVKQIASSSNDFKSHPSKVSSSPESKKEVKKQKPPATSQPKKETKKQASQTAVESQSRNGRDEAVAADFKSYPSKVSSSTPHATSLNNHKKAQKRSTTTNEEIPPPCFDEEVAVDSAAAALKKAIENAQESIRIAKESVGRKKEGFKRFSSKSFKDSLKVKSRVTNVNTDEDPKGKDHKNGNFYDGEKLFGVKNVINETQVNDSEPVKNSGIPIMSRLWDNNKTVGNSKHVVDETVTKSVENKDQKNGNFYDGENLFGAKNVINEVHVKVSEPAKSLETPIMPRFELNDNKTISNSKQVGETVTESVENKDHKNGNFYDGEKLFGAREVINETHVKVSEPVKNIEIPIVSRLLDNNKTVCNSKLVGETETESVEDNACENPRKDDEGPDGFLELEGCERKQEDTESNNLTVCQKVETKKEILQTTYQNGYEKRSCEESFGLLESNIQENLEHIHDESEEEKQVEEDRGVESHSEEERFYDVYEAETIKNAQTYVNNIETSDSSQKEDYENCEAEETYENSSSDYDDAEENENVIGARNILDDTENVCKVDQNVDQAEICQDIDDASLHHEFQVEEKEAYENFSSDETEEKTIHCMELEVKKTVEKEDNHLQQPHEQTPETKTETDTGPPQEQPKDACSEPDLPKPNRETEQVRIKLAVERVIREARERAFAEVRQRVIADTQEKVAKTSIDKTAAQSKLRSERALVERATAEARQRALEKLEKQTSLTSQTNTESALRSKAKLEKHNRIMERAAKALAEKEKRDLLARREQAERNRLAEHLDADVKRWSTGKEGNLRALLSTLQYILGADSGWQAVSLTDIITTGAVKKAYRKATLCVHPDKLQQRGASIQQKYICEKVFDLLKAAWNRFNSEER